MVARIARKEMTEMLRDGRFRWAAAIVLTLLAAALATGWTHYRRVSALHEAAHYGVYAFKPKMPLSFVDRGVDSYVGVTAWLEAHKQNDFKYRPAQDATAIERFGEWTAAAVLQLLMPLQIIMLAFPAFAGEREQGTLRQLLALGVDPRHVALGKAVGIAAAVGILLIPAAVVGTAAIAFASDAAAVTATVPRISLMALGYLAYSSIFLALGLAVSTRAASPRTALVLLLAFWTVSTLLVPRAASDVARRLRPTPSAFAFNSTLERALRGEGDPAKELEQRMKRKYNVTSVDSLPFNFAGLSLQDGEERGNVVFDREYGRLWSIFRAQNRIHDAGGLVAPLLAVRSLSMALAGTDFEHHSAFATAAEQYRRVLVKQMNDAVTHAPRTDSGFVVTGDAELWRSVPPFAYSAPPVGWVARYQRWNVALLALWVIASVAAVGWALRRMPVDAVPAVR